jgi:hypothetical protein
VKRGHVSPPKAGGSGSYPRETFVRGCCKRINNRYVFATLGRGGKRGLVNVEFAKLR